MMNKIISVILFMGVAHVVCASAPDGVSNGYNWHYTIDGQNMVLTIKDVTPTDAAEADLDISLVEIISGTYVVKIDDEAFKACKDLKTIILPSHVSRITAHAFAGCDKLTEINIRETKKVFVKSNNGLLVDPECGNLIACPKGRITAEIPFGITNVLQCAFKDCRSLKTLSVPITVKRMGAFAFDGCVNLETVYYGSGSNDGVRWGSIHFEEASSTYANNNPLYYAKRFCVRSLSIGADIPITSLSFPYSSEVNRYAFYGCKTIQSITLNKTRVNNRSFAECHSLSSMYIQNQGCEWGGTSFYGCTNLTSITLAGSATLDYKVVDGVVYSADEKRIMLFPPSKREYVVPETIFMPGDHSLKRFEYTFAGCRLLEKLVLPRTANYIMYDFIRDCGVEDVFTVYVPDSYQQVEPGAFDGCANGTTMIFEGDPPWKELWDYRRKIHEPNISRIGISAEHYDSWAENAKDLLPRCYIEYFNEKYEADGDHCACSGTTVPVGAINSGVTPTKVVINSQWESLPVTEITASSFMGYVQLVSVELPATLEIIGDVAFRDCERLELSELPKSVRRIGHNAFRGAGFAKGDNGCVILSGWILHADGLIGSYQIPTTVEHIADGAFAGCSQLNSIVIPLNVKTIGKSAFDGTGVSDSATGFVVRDGWLLAYNGDVPTNLTIPSTVRRIADGVFSYCKNLMSVTLPDTVEYVGDNAFAECEKLMEVSYDSRYTNFGRDVFVGGSADLRRQDRRYAEIIYDSQGGGHVQSRYQQRGTKIGELPIVEREHYMFLGWYTEKDGGEQVDENYLVEHSITIYAHWRSQLNFYPEGGVCDVLTISCLNDVLSEPFPVPTWDDEHVFIGWFTELGVEKTGISRGDGNMSLYAHWKVNRYQVTFDANGGEGGDSIEVEFGSEVLKIAPMVRKTGFEFVGWFTAADGGEQLLPATVVSRDVTYYAHWERVMDTISFETHGGGSIPSIQRERGKVIGDLPIPTREGYSFLGWFLDDTDGDSISESYVVSGPLTLHARWKIRSYSLTLDLNYGGQLERISYEYGTAIGEIETPKRLGYVFRCWSMDVYGNIPVDRDFIITKDVTFYAQWSMDICWVVFDLNFKGATNVSRPYAFGAELGFVEDPEREGYEFVGWFTAPDEGTEVCSSSIVTGDATYYAHWRVISHVVSLCLNYDGRYLEDEERAHGSPVGALPSPIRSGYSFLGWFLANGECVHGEMIVMSDIVLFAHWKENTDNWFTISFDAQGGEVDPKTFKVKSEITSLPVPVWHGYEFIGWAAQKIGGDIIGRGGPCEPFAVTEDMTLYAYWRPMYYKLCLASDIIGVPADMCSYQIGQDVKLSNPFHNPGYTFLGWGLDYKKNGGQVVYVEGQVVPSLSDVEGQRVWLYAIWGEPEPLDFPTALNVDCSLTWTTGGKAGWKAMATDVACDGISCARSGDISSYENSWVETTVEGAGTLEFSWKNSCKTDDDSFGLIIDGKLQGSCYGGNARWQKMTVKLGKGTHTLRWVYERGYSYGSAATGYGYIDNVMWVPATTYYIEFVANGGKGTMECQEMVSNLEAKLNLNSFVKEDCHFCGWALNSDGIVVYGDGQSVCGLNPDENGIVRLYAIWEPSYSFTFRSLDATSVEVTGMSVSGQMSGRIVIPEKINDKNVVKIGASAFSGRNEIYSVSIPATVNKIGSSAFSGCVNLRSVSLEEGVVEIADLAFSQCASLQYVNIPLSVETIGCSAFKGCAGLGDGVVVVDDCVLTVNGECPTDVRLPSNIRILTSGTFMSCESLASITIPPGIDNIGMRTFAWCSKLGFVALPSMITNLDFMAFSCCSSLKSITIPSSVVTIGEAAFMLCGALEKIIIQGGVERISEQAFLDCLALTEITLPKSVRFVGRDAFNGCSSMKIVWVEKGDVKRMRDLLGGSGLRVDSIEFQECEEPIPDLPTSASAGDVANALKGSCDDRLMANVTDAVMYEKYRAWALKIGAGAVKNSENAWVSFAVDSDALLEKSPVDEDLAIEEFKPTDETGRFDFTVRVKDIEIGSGALADNLKKVFGLTGATTLDAGAFKHENVDVEFDTPKDGVLKFTAKPAKVSDRFFMRVKVK